MGLAARDTLEGFDDRLHHAQRPFPSAQRVTSIDSGTELEETGLESSMLRISPPMACLLAALVISAIGLSWSLGRHSRRHTEKIVPREEIQTWSQARFVEKRQSLLRTFANCPEKHPRGKLLVEDAMTRRVTTAHPHTSLAQLREMLPKDEMRHIPICDREGVLLGIVSDRDLRSPQGKTAADVMTRQLITVNRELPLLTAATLMLQRQVSSLLVLDEGRLVGTITTTDLVLVLQCLLHLAYHDADESIFETEPASV